MSDVPPPIASTTLDGLLALVSSSAADQLDEVVVATSAVLGARSAQLYAIDYGQRRLEPFLRLPEAESMTVEGTMAGRAFMTQEMVAAGDDVTTMWLPVSDGTDRLGVLELGFDRLVPVPDGLPTGWPSVLTILVLGLIVNRRYTDRFTRTRRAESLTTAAEMQWDLLPPLSWSATDVSVSGILEPAYDIGGDTFDYAIDDGSLTFTLIDAMGHGLPAVLLSVAAIGNLRNARREQRSLEEAYRSTDALIAEQFGDSSFVTGQIGRLDALTGELEWINAGHPPPLLLRDRTTVSELVCRPSLPMGLGGQARQVATESLQSGDRVLLYSDGVTEAHAGGGDQFGVERLGDFLVRATLDGMSPPETVRRLSAAVLEHHGDSLADDATLLLIDYRTG